MIKLIARTTQKDYRALASASNVPQLLTIPYSHFCEMGGWSLSAAGVAFQEQPFAPGQHILPVLALRTGGSDGPHLSSSSAVRGPNQVGRHYTGVPALALPNGRVLVDSWSIVAEAARVSAMPMVPKGLIQLLDKELAPATRALAYAALLRPGNSDIWKALCTDAGSIMWRTVWWAGFGTRLTQRMRETFKTSDTDAMAACRRRVDELFNKIEVEHLRALAEHQFLGGTQPGLADIALAALASPIVGPSLYCGGKYAHIFEELEARDAEYAKMLMVYRATAVGKHVLRVYELRVGYSGA